MSIFPQLFRKATLLYLNIKKIAKQICRRFVDGSWMWREVVVEVVGSGRR